MQARVPSDDRAALTRRGLRLEYATLGWFLLLATYVAVQSVIVLLARFHSKTSPIGIAWLVLTAAAMFLLAYGKGKTGAALSNTVLQKESKVTVVDGLLAVAVLAGLV